MTSAPSRDLLHWLRLVVLSVAVIGLGYVLLQAVLHADILSKQPCSNPVQPLGSPWAGVFVFAALGLFSAGALLGHWRHAALVGEGGDCRDGRGTIVVHVALGAFFVLAVVLLAYETWAVWDQDRWPITSFVRCANRNHTVAALATSGAVAFLLGQWLWHPWDSIDDDAADR